MSDGAIRCRRDSVYPMIASGARLPWQRPGLTHLNSNRASWSRKRLSDVGRFDVLRDEWSDRSVFPGRESRSNNLDAIALAASVKQKRESDAGRVSLLKQKGNGGWFASHAQTLQFANCARKATTFNVTPFELTCCCGRNQAASKHAWSTRREMLCGCICMATLRRARYAQRYRGCKIHRPDGSRRGRGAMR